MREEVNTTAGRSRASLRLESKFTAVHGFDCYKRPEILLSVNGRWLTSWPLYWLPGNLRCNVLRLVQPRAETFDNDLDQDA